MTSRSDADVFGFRRTDIYDFLDSHGLTLDREDPATIATELESGRLKEAVMPQNDPEQGTKGSGERFTFSAIAAAKRAEFISYREAMTKLRESTGDALKHVAVGLKSHGIHEKHMAYLAGPEQAVRRITGSDDLAALLDETIDSGGITPAWVGPDEQADPDRCGWIRREFVREIQDADLPCPDTLRNSAELMSQEGPADPDWVKPYIGRHQFSLGHAAALLAGIHPDPQYSYSNSEQVEMGPWRTALIDAANNGEIEGSTSWRVEREDRQRMLSHADIRTWCAKRGHKWPIPELNPQPATTSEALAEADRMKREIERLKAELAEAREGVYPEDSDQWPEELGVALTAWRAAVNNAASSGKKPGAYIRAWLDEAYPGQAGSERHKRIAIVANWDKTPGPK